MRIDNDNALLAIMTTSSLIGKADCNDTICAADASLVLQFLVSQAKTPSTYVLRTHGLHTHMVFANAIWCSLMQYGVR